MCDFALYLNIKVAYYGAMNFLIKISIMCICRRGCTCVGGQKCTLDPLGLELQALSCPVSVLGTEPGPVL